jgi:hypothetical protein
MADITVHHGTVIERNGSRSTWQFSVTINGDFGILEADAPAEWSEATARAALKIWLERHPNERPGMGGVVSTDPLGDQGEETSTGSGDDDDDNDGDEDEDEDEDDEDDEDDDDDEGDDDTDDDGDDGSDDDGEDGGDDEESDTGDEGDGVGDSRREDRIAAAVVRGLALGLLTWKDEGDEDTGPRHQERLAILVAKVTSGGVVIPRHDDGEGIGHDTGDINHDRIAALIARALARGGVIGPPDDSGDGDGTGRPIPSLVRIVLDAPGRHR